MAVVLDNGSGSIKTGISEDFSPAVVFPTLIGYPKKQNQSLGMDQKDYFVGQEVEQKRSILNITKPI